MALGGVLLKSTQTALRLAQFLASVLVLGVFSWFLAYLATHHLPQSNGTKAVEGISGAAVIYTFFAAVLTCFLGGLTFAALLAILLDIAFVGGFVAVAILTKDGARACSGTVRTPLGTGDAATGKGLEFSVRGSNNVTYYPNLGRACNLQKAVFAVAIINVILFILSALVEVALMRHHKREKRYGPSPSNGYTKGSSRFRFGRRNKHRGTRDAELATAGGAPLGTGEKTAVGGNGYTGASTRPGGTHF
ncbi:MAG: hypothetical protein M1832_003632 [Thelocarpon impressellum]|nr:MAG: hypothetical protein M1832_003632 [Thelocarpon impressellum]